MTLRLGLPIGSLQRATLEIFARAGINVFVRERSYCPECDDEELALRLVRPQDMSRFVERDILDAGITGLDWVRENGSDVRLVSELNYSKRRAAPVRWVLAVPEASPVRAAADLEGKRIATELVNVTTAWLAERGIRASVEFSHGATEGKAPDLVDAIVDVTETGSTLQAHGLRIVETVLVSSTQLIAGHRAWADPWKRSKIEALLILVQGAMNARDMVGLKMNVPEGRLDAVLARLSSLRAPTVSPLAGGAGHAVEIVVSERFVRRVIPALKSAGAEGIVEYPLNKVIP